MSRLGLYYTIPKNKIISAENHFRVHENSITHYVGYILLLITNSILNFTEDYFNKFVIDKEKLITLISRYFELFVRKFADIQ